MILANDGRLGYTAVTLGGDCRYSNTYYANTYDLAENPLKTALKTIVSTGVTSLGYNSARDQMFMSIDNKRTNGQGATVNTVECVYTGKVITGYANRNAAQNLGFNTEHTWPQSLFNSSEPMQSDLFHLFPTDGPPNNSRGNLAFGIPTQPYRDVAINAPSILGANGLYAPRDEQKGVVGRAMLYFATRHTNYSNFATPQEPTLRAWAKQFPPTAAEKRRCQDIFALQRNRNPFIDYPQFLDRITSVVTTAGGTTAAVPVQSEPEANFGSIQDTAARVYSLVVTNAGNAPLNLGAATLNNAGVAFTLVNNSGAAQTLAPGASHTYYIRFASQILGPYTATLTYTHNGSGGSVTTNIIVNRTLSLPAQLIGGYQEPVLFPVPAQDHVTISSPDFHELNSQITILTSTGRVVSNQAHTFSQEGKASVNVASLPRGLYLLRLQSGGYAKTWKFQKQ